MKLKISLRSTLFPISSEMCVIILPSFTVEKSEDDMEREARLVEQWVGLTEERNAVFVPAPGSGIPGAPANWYVQKKTLELFVSFT